MGCKSYVLGFIGIILLPIYAIYAVFAFIFHTVFYCCFGYRYDGSSYRRDLKSFLYRSFCCGYFFSKKGRKKFNDFQKSNEETFNLIRFFINQVVLTTFDIGSDIYQAGRYFTM